MALSNPCSAMSTTTSSAALSPNLQISSKPNLSPPCKTTFSFTSQNPKTFKTLKCSASDLNPSAPILAASTLKSRLRDGDTLYGIFLLSFSPTIAEISGLAGYDFAVVDMEHGPGGISDALHCLRALAATGTPAILRLPQTCPTWAKKALDLGPQGIMFPKVESSEMAKKAVSYCKFPPKGIRGSAHPLVRASNYGIDEGYLSNYEEELLIMCQIESEEGVKKAEEIAAVEGVDCLKMGPRDLSASMGYLSDPGHKKVKEMMRLAEKRAMSGGAYLAGIATPHDGPIEMGKRGYNMVAGTVDVALFRSAAVEDVRRFKMSLKEDSDGEESCVNGTGGIKLLEMTKMKSIGANN